MIPDWLAPIEAILVDHYDDALLVSLTLWRNRPPPGGQGVALRAAGRACRALWGNRNANAPRALAWLILEAIDQDPAVEEVLVPLFHVGGATALAKFLNVTLGKDEE